MARSDLNHDQFMILAYMARQKADNRWTMAVWIAEGCGHFYETSWASSRLPTLIKRGLVERSSLKGYYGITDAGRAEHAAALARRRNG